MSVGVEFAPKRKIVEQAKDRRERLDVFPIFGIHEGAQSRDLVRSHGECVGAGAEDRVQKHHKWGVIREVMVAVLEAKIEMVEKRAIGVFDVEITLVDHELEQGRIDLGQWLALEHALVRGLDLARGVGLELGLFGDARLDHIPRCRTLERIEDRSIQVEVLDGFDADPAGVIRGSTMRDGGFAMGARDGAGGSVLGHATAVWPLVATTQPHHRAARVDAGRTTPWFVDDQGIHQIVGSVETARIVATGASSPVREGGEPTALRMHPMMVGTSNGAVYGWQMSGSRRWFRFTILDGVIRAMRAAQGELVWVGGASGAFEWMPPGAEATYGEWRQTRSSLTVANHGGRHLVGGRDGLFEHGFAVYWDDSRNPSASEWYSMLGARAGRATAR